MTTRLTLYEDVLAPGDALATSGGVMRALYVVNGSIVLPRGPAQADDGPSGPTGPAK